MSTDVDDTTPGLSAFVADEIAALLGRRRMSKAELARRLKVDETWVGKRLSGRTAFGLDDIERIAPVLGVDATELLPPRSERSERVTHRYLPGERVIGTIGATTPLSITASGHSVTRTRPLVGMSRRPHTPVST